MTEKLPDVEAYRPPVNAPVDASEPPVHAAGQPVEAYQPPPAAPVRHPRPPRSGGRRVALVVALGLLLSAGAAVASMTDGRQEAAPPRVEAVGVPGPPPVEDGPGAPLVEDGPGAPPVAAVPAPGAELDAPEAVPGWPDLPALPAGAEKDARNATDGGSTWIRFANSTGEAVTVMWLDYGHVRVRYRTLAARQAYDQPTYAGHVWVVTRADGTAIAVFEAAAEPARAVIR